jgi:hypothetical protein
MHQLRAGNIQVINEVADFVDYEDRKGILFSDGTLTTLGLYYYQY